MAVPHPPDDAFASFEAGNGNPNACTPSLEDGFRGIKINAPSVVTFTHESRDRFTGAFAVFPICGAYHLESFLLYQLGGFSDAAKLVATDVGDHQVYAGKMQGGDLIALDPSPPGRTEAELKGQSVIGAFNENVLDFLRLPERAGRYQVFVTLGPYKSNVVTVSVERNLRNPLI